MEMIKKVEREGGLALHAEHTVEDNLARHKWLMEHYDQFAPLVDVVPPEIAEEVWPALEMLGDPRTMRKTRAWVKLVVQFLLEPGNYRKSTVDMCKELDIQYNLWMSRVQIHPSVWRFINGVVGPILLLRSQSQILAATEEAAVQGDHRDRRLYFELVGLLKRAGGSGQGGQVNITFVQDALDRPPVPTIEVIPERLVEGPGSESSEG